MIDGLYNETWKDLKSLPYCSMITMYGGKDAVLRNVLDSIAGDIRALEGKPVTVDE